jgi:transposase
MKGSIEIRVLSDEQWSFIKPHFPPEPIVGKADHRETINGIPYVLF